MLCEENPSIYLPNLDSKPSNSYFNLNESSTKTTPIPDNFFSLNNNMKQINDEKNNNLKAASNLPEFDTNFGTDMFAAFDNHFKSEKPTNNKTNSAFGDDPVSTTTTATTTGSFVANFDDVFKNNFEDEFSAMNIANTDKKKIADKTYNLDNFGSFADEKQDNTRVRNNTNTNNGSNNNFASMFSSQNKNILEKNVYRKGGDKVSDKFVADFPKSDNNYDKDLEEALKRSLVEQ